jgi:GAF domain-containing protein
LSVSRWVDIVRLLRAKPEELSLGRHVADVAREILAGDHSSITLRQENRFVVLAATDGLAEHLDERQIVIGHGPIFSVFETGTPTVMADTNEELTRVRWPVFGPLLTESGIRSLLSFPLVSGAARIGAITSYRRTPLFPDPDTYASGLILATLATEIVLGIQAGAAIDPMGFELDAVSKNNAVVQQAVGMTAEQLGISVADAAIRLRAHAFATDLPLAALARRVVNGETSLEP